MTDTALEPGATRAAAPAVEAGRRTRFACRPNAALAARAAGVPVLDVVVPVFIEAGPFVTRHESLRGFVFDVATGKQNEVAV
jgi:1-acyl-sn-glycerol-3-phosphate acyltransferase